MTGRTIGPGLVLGAVVLGVVVGEAVGPSPAREAVVAAIVAGVGALVCALHRRGVAGLALGCAAAFLAGGAGMSRALDGQVHSPLRAAVEGRQSATVDVTLVTDPASTRFSARALARVGAVRAGAVATGGGGRTVAVDASGDAAARLAVLAAGDRVRLVGYFRPLGPSDAAPASPPGDPARRRFSGRELPARVRAPLRICGQ